MRFLVVGAGFAGATVARELADRGHQIDVIDQRNHIGGNAYDYVNEHGIRVHKYGTHLFHTSNREVFDWLSKFTQWTPYEHKLLALLSDGTYVPFRVNQNTLKVVPKERVFETFIEPYSKKMWGEWYPELSKEVFDRVKMKDNTDDRCFSDTYQFLPTLGYEHMFKNIFDHPNITVTLDTPYDKKLESDYDHVFNSMAIDQYYDYEFGELPYRSIKFVEVTMNEVRVFPAAVVNFTDSEKFTRATEWKHLPDHGENDIHTTITYEEPCDYHENNERYYPIITEENRSLYQRYKDIPNDKVTFIGRCGMYVYLDMHQVVSSSLALVKKFFNQ